MTKAERQKKKADKRIARVQSKLEAAIRAGNRSLIAKYTAERARLVEREGNRDPESKV